MENSNNVENLNRKEEKGLVIQDLNEMPMTNNPNMIASNFYTNIKDKKQLFNLEQNVDFLLNDCENKEINVKGVIIKVYVKEMKNPITDEETGEIFDSLSAAAQWCNTSVSSISTYLHDKKRKLSAGKHPETKQKLTWSIVE